MTVASFPPYNKEMKRSRQLIAFSCVLLAGCLVKGSPSAGYSAPDFTVEALTSKAPQKLSSLNGKVVLVDFWATYCGPCRSSASEIEQAYKKYHDKGFEVISVTGEDRKTVEAFEKATPHQYPVYLDSKLEAHEAYQVSAYPNFFLVGKNGKVVWHQEGYSSGASQDIMNAVDKAISG